LAALPSCLAGIDDHRGQPPVAETAFRLGGECYPFIPGELCLIPVEDLPSLRYAFIQYPQLGPTDARTDVAQPVIVAHVAVFIVRGGITGLGGQKPRFLYPFLALGHHRTPPGGGDVIVATQTLT